MKNWLTNLFAHRREDPARHSTANGLASQPQMAGTDLEQQQELQALRIDLQAREQEVKRLSQEIERLRYRQEQSLAENLDARLIALFEDLSGPASQILALDYLLVEEQKPVQASDVLNVARRMVRALERQGLVFDGKASQQVAFDPNRHTPIGQGHIPATGQPVTVRFAGASYAGKIIQKAGIE